MTDGSFWRHLWLAFVKRGPYDPTGRDQQIARLRAALARVNDGEPRHEVECPNCGATIRARMADAPEETG